MLETAMDPDSEEIVLQIRGKFEALLAYVTESEDQVPSAYQVERHLLTNLIRLGRALLLAFILTQQARIQQIDSVRVNGQALRLHGKKRRSLRSIFGKITFERGYYYQKGRSYFLLDARLKLPEHSLSDLLREWVCHLACYLPYHKSGGLLKDLVTQKLTPRPLEAAVLEDSALVEAFYEQASVPEAATEAAILVAQADGKGVPMLPESPQPVRVRLGKGEKLGRKKEAIVTSVYTIAPRVRSPEEVVASLFKQTKVSASALKRGARKRLGPQNKRLWATLAGKEAGVSFLARQVGLREGEHIRMRVALTDGSAPLQEKMRHHLPGFVLVLDIIHAVEYLWEAGNSLYGEKSDKREGWVAERALLLLRGQTETVMEDLRALAALPRRKKTAKTVLLKVADYYERNQEGMHYDTYLASGWPIATGVIEGACRHLVKDRCELSGMHWRVAGAEAVLRLRSVAENEDWDRFQEFRRERRDVALYGSCVGGEATTIEMAAVRAKAKVAECLAA
jgi:hypothetical protein